jgi:hypothetical protein
MFLRTRVALFVAVALAPFAVQAQSTSGRAPVGCTYETCALRVEPAFIAAPRLLRGRAGVEVGRLGGFGGGVDTLLAGPELAATHARRYVRDTRVANTLGLLGAVAFVVAGTRTDWFRDTADNTDRAIGISALALGLASIPFNLSAKRELSRSVWFYNAALAR